MSQPVSASKATDRSVGVPVYPARRSDWLHQFTSLLSRADVAKQIGRDAVLLLIAVAIQEDRQQYRSAPIYFDSELMRVTGIRSLTRLDKIIRIAEDAGWLMAVYPDDDDTVGQYWTLIPQRLKVFETVPELPGNTASSAALPEITPRTEVPAVTTSEPANGNPGTISQTTIVPTQSMPLCVPNVNAQGHPAQEAMVKQNVVQAATPVQKQNSAAVATIGQTSPQDSARAVNVSTTAVVPERRNLQVEAKLLWQMYPRRNIFEQEQVEILRALEKVPYHTLYALVEQYAAEFKLRQCHPSLILPIAKWFQQQAQTHCNETIEISSADTSRRGELRHV